jgi:hypothetical protein
MGGAVSDSWDVSQPWKNELEQQMREHAEKNGLEMPGPTDVVSFLASMYDPETNYWANEGADLIGEDEA